MISEQELPLRFDAYCELLDIPSHRTAVSPFHFTVRLEPLLYLDTPAPFLVQFVVPSPHFSI